jgi:hypothetical protein
LPAQQKASPRYQETEPALFVGPAFSCGRHSGSFRVKTVRIESSLDRRRKTTWSQFLRTHWDTLAAADFFTT